MHDWTLFRIRGARGAPALDPARFLGCVAAARGPLGACLQLLWRRSALPCDLRQGKPSAPPRQLTGLGTGAFPAFVTGEYFAHARSA